ncbi:putative efflux protein, MATE family [Clostridium cavendishii DSM 21758]|uniref:Probable multidrug resistance protein NorM n=1 Tax=Clostridium cavendishii DSM 21758 TaxID=1121302 RepID=A0A1M6CF15_9CLOT|nr:MATE family efflux transporter [Clostridium cavendishii]SHI59582.1 putative efflux protein, MATE family [Clostridium cavendishii DSM 21758]
MNKKYYSKKSYYNAILQIAIPVSTQSLFQASLSVIDQFMVGQLGQEAIAAVGLGSRFPFVFLVTLTAIGATTSIMVSQYWGKKDNKNITNVFAGNLIFGMIITLIFSIISLSFSKQVLGFYTKDSNIIKLGSEYLIINAISYVPMLLITIYASILRSTEHIKSPMYAGVFAVILNTLLNYILIFGKIGLPTMGFLGTAYATTITRFLEAVLLIAFTYINKYPGAYKLKDISNVSFEFMKKIFIIAIPLLINEFMWALGETMYSIVYGRMGTAEVASMTLTYPIQSLSIGLFSGVSSAAGIIIGNKLGVGENELAFKYSKKFVRLGIIGSVVFGVLLVACSNLYISVFNIASDLKECTFKLLVMFSIVLWIKVSNMIIGGGILRSGGKTKYTLYLDMLGTWGIGVPIGFFSAFVLKLPIQWVYLIISGEELVRFIVGLKIMYSRRWMRNLTESNSKVSIEQVI